MSRLWSIMAALGVLCASGRAAWIVDGERQESGVGSTNGSVTASDVSAATDLFDGILSATDTNVQSALETLDDASLGLWTDDGDGTISRASTNETAPAVTVTALSPSLRLTETNQGEYALVKRVGLSNELLVQNRVAMPAGSGQSAAFAYDYDNPNVVTMANEASFDFERTDPFSVECWIYCTDLGNNIYGDQIFSKAQSGYRGISALVSPAGSISVNLTSVSGPNQISFNTGSATIIENTWYHVVITYDGSSTASGLTAYVNDSPKARYNVVDSLTGTILTGDPFRVGNYGPFYKYRNFDGFIDEMVVYDKELSAGEVTATYNSGSGTYHTQAANTVAIWHFDGDALDATDHDNDGTWSGSTGESYGQGKMNVPAGNQLSTVVSSLDGVDGGEKGIHIFGDADGKAIVQGGTAVELKGGSTTAVHVDDGGLVGINNQTPAEQLDVAGHVRIGSDTYGVVLGAGDDALIHYDGADLVIDPDVAGSGGVKVDGELKCDSIDIQENGTSKFTVDAEGSPTFGKGETFCELFYGNAGQRLFRAYGNGHTLAFGTDALNQTQTAVAYSIAMGYRSQYSNVTGDNNITLGALSGEFLTGSDSVAVGYRAGQDGGAHQVAIGAYALNQTLGTSYNVGLGYQCGYFAENASKSILVGAYAGYGDVADRLDGEHLIGIGYSCMKDHISDLAHHDIVIGGESDVEGDIAYATVIGHGLVNSNTASFIIGGGGTNYLQGTAHELHVPEHLTIGDALTLTPVVAPSVTNTGTIFYDSDDGKVKVWTGAAWENLN